jgi:hypothetical protein
MWEPAWELLKLFSLLFAVVCLAHLQNGFSLRHPERARREGEEVELLEGVSTQNKVDRSRRINADGDKNCVLKIIS